MKSLLKNKKGAIYIMMFFILLMIVLFFIVCIEITKYFMVVYNVETNLQRVANNAIEFNMDDAWRRDGYT